MSTPEDPYAGQPAPDHGTPTEPAQQQPVAGPSQALPPAQPPLPPGYYYPPAQPYVPPYAALTAPRRWVWFGAGAASMLGLGLFGLIIYAVLSFAEDEIPYEDGDYVVDQVSVERAVDKPCADMNEAASILLMVGDTKASVTSLRRFTASVDKIVAAIDDANPNADAEAWRDDWIMLADSLNDYADEAAAGGTNAYSMPDATGSRPISDRMYYGSPEGCEVPARVEILDADVAAAYDED